MSFIQPILTDIFGQNSKIEKWIKLLNLIKKIMFHLFNLLLSLNSSILIE